MITVGGLYPAPLDLTLKRLLAHDPRYPLVVDLVSLAPKLIGHPAISVSRKLHHDLFDPIPKIRFFLLGFHRFLPGAMVIGAARKPHHLAPPLEAAKLLAVIGDESSLLRCAVYSTAFFKSSFSIVNLPPSAPAPQCVPKTAFHSATAPSAKPASS